MRTALFLLELMLMAAGACAPESALRHPGRLGNCRAADAACVHSHPHGRCRRQVVTYRSGSEESELDVWVTFRGKEWDRVWTDWITGRATRTVIAILGKYQARPETYFATLPRRATRWLPWRARITIEISLHRLIGDNDIHFSAWWISKDRWKEGATPGIMPPASNAGAE